MLGIAYIGFVWMLEAAGIRFLGLGGCSAGAITAGTIASTRERPDEPCSQQVLKVGDPMNHVQGTGAGNSLLLEQLHLDYSENCPHC
jgi:predicted acylesterase/phospholipase RssA